MGMGFGANYADVMDAQEVAKLTPRSWEALVALWEGDKLRGDNAFTVLCFLIEPDMYGYEQAEDYIQDGSPLQGEDTYEARVREYQATWESLCAEFRVNTFQRGGSALELGMAYHSEDEGDRYDEVTGAFFTVSGVWERTPSGKAFESIIERKFYVSLG